MIFLLTLPFILWLQYYLSFFALTVLVIFGILTYRNIHLLTTVSTQQSIRTRLSKWEQQITRMMVIQTVLNISCTLPRFIFVIYTIATVQQRAMRSLNQIYIEALVDQLTICIMCLDFVSSFYIFIFSSKRFRQTIKMYLQRCLHLQNNRVVPFDATLLENPHLL